MTEFSFTLPTVQTSNPAFKMANNDGVPQSIDSWCKTDLNTRKESKGSFTWTISGFLGRREEYGEGEGMMSREFYLLSPGGKKTKKGP